MYKDTIEKLNDEIKDMEKANVFDMVLETCLISKSFEVNFEMSNNGLDDIYVEDKDTGEEFTFGYSSGSHFPEHIAISLLYQANLIHKASDLGIEIDEVSIYWNQENKNSVNQYGL